MGVGRGGAVYLGLAKGVAACRTDQITAGGNDFSVTGNGVAYGAGVDPPGIGSRRVDSNEAIYAGLLLIALLASRVVVAAPELKISEKPCFSSVTE